MIVSFKLCPASGPEMFSSCDLGSSASFWTNTFLMSRALSTMCCYTMTKLPISRKHSNAGVAVKTAPMSPAVIVLSSSTELPACMAPQVVAVFFCLHSVSDIQAVVVQSRVMFPAPSCTPTHATSPSSPSPLVSPLSSSLCPRLRQ